MPNSLADNVHEPVLLLLERTLVIFVKEIMVMLAIMRSFLKSVMVESKGSHPERKVQFFLTLFKRPLTPPFRLNIMW